MTGSGPRRGIFRADDERTVRGRSVRGHAAPASPPEAQRDASERREGCRTGAQLRARLEEAGAEPQAAPCSVCSQTHRCSVVYMPIFFAYISVACYHVFLNPGADRDYYSTPSLFEQGILRVFDGTVQRLCAVRLLASFANESIHWTIED